MIKLNILWILVFTCLSVMVAAQEVPQETIDKQMGICARLSSNVSPRFQSTGGLNPGIRDDIGAFSTSPTSLGYIDSSQAASFYSDLFCQRRSMSLFYATPLSTNLPLNNVSGGVFVQKNVFGNSGYVSGLRNQDVVGLGSSFELPINIDVVSGLRFGFNVKGILQDIRSDERLVPAIDIGAQGRYFLPEISVPYIKIPNYVDFGLTIGNVNFLEEIKEDPTASTAEPWLNHKIPMSVTLGARAPFLMDGFFNTFSFYTAGEMTELSIGSEFYLQDNLVLRGSFVTDLNAAEPDPTIPVTDENTFQKSSRLNFGLGFLFDRLPGVGFLSSKGRFDYNFSSLTDGSGKQFSLGVTLLGLSKDTPPTIVEPENNIRFSKKELQVYGKSEPNSTVYVYNNSLQIKQIDTDNKGEWNSNRVLLREGKNEITARSKSEGKDTSNFSKPVQVIYDSKAPELSFLVSRSETHLDITLKSNEPLFSALVQEKETWQPIKKIRDLHYKLSFPIEEDITKVLQSDLVIKVEDLAENERYLSLNPLLLNISKPRDKQILYQNKILMMGDYSSLVRSILLNDEEISLAKDGGFIHSVYLKNGKNLLRVKMLLNDGGALENKYRLLVIQRFDDITSDDPNQRELEYLGTLGYVKPLPGNVFEPEKSITRKEVAKWMFSFLNLKEKRLLDNPFLDVSKTDDSATIIASIVDEGVMLPFSDGTFRPEAPVSVTQAYQMFVNLELMMSDNVLVSNDNITRRDFALIFTRLPAYSQRVSDLFNWKKGF